MVNKFYIFFMLTAIMASCEGERPDDLGINNGKLKSCPETPNCIISYEKDSAHYLPPIHYKNSRKAMRGKVLHILDSLDRAEVIEKDSQYVYAEFHTTFGFVDDVEFHFPADSGYIHFRSASRIGKSDMGQNRMRMEELKKLIGN